MLLPGILLLSLVGSVSCNTEIVNIAATTSAAIDLAFTKSWPILSPNTHTLQVNSTSAPLGFAACQELPQENGRSCPHERWFVLDLDAETWRGFYKFTLRLSWPAFYPTDIKITVFDPPRLSSSAKPSLANRKTRRKYARIQFMHAGVLTPSLEAVDEVLRYHVPFIVTLEPLHFGVLPSSVIPVVLALVVVTFVGFTLAPSLNSYLQRIAQLAREDVKDMSKTM